MIMKESDVVKHILRLYDMEVKTSYNYLRPGVTYPDGKLIVRVEILFNPKDESVMSPSSVKSKGTYEYKPNWKGEYKDNFEDMWYIRGREMPILNYISGMYHFDNFCEKIVKDEYIKIKEKYY
jgi:hypothetical protein